MTRLWPGGSLVPSRKPPEGGTYNPYRACFPAGRGEYFLALFPAVSESRGTKTSADQEDCTGEETPSPNSKQFHDMSSEKELQSTAQGRHTPVPVGDSSGGPGSIRPSSSVWATPPGGGNLTECRQKALKRKLGTLRRSPTQITSTGEGEEIQDDASKDGHVISYLWDEESQTSRKRLREEIPLTRMASLKRAETVLKSTAMDLVSKVNKEVKDLAEITKGSRNTKVEIKDAVERLDTFLQKLTRGKILESMTEEACTNSIMMIEDTVEVAIQTSPEEDLVAGLRQEIYKLQKKVATLEEEVGRQKGREKRTLITTLDGVDNLEDWKKIVWNPWSSELLARVESAGNQDIFKTKDSVVKIVWVEKTKAETHARRTYIIQKHRRGI